MPKVLFVIGSLEVGGTEKQMVLLIKGLLNCGWQCEVFALDLVGPLAGELVRLGVPLHDGGYRRPSHPADNFIRLLKAQLRLLLVALRLRPQVVHAYLPLANLMGAVAGRMTGAGAVVTSYRDLGTYRKRYPAWRFFERLSNSLSHGVTVNSKAVGRNNSAYDGRVKAKLALIYNGLDLPPAPARNLEREEIRGKVGVAEDEAAIVSVANLVPYKGHQDLIRSLPRLLAMHPKIKLLLVGEDRGIKGDLEETARELGVAQHLVFLGHRDDVRWLLRGMDIFVLSSHEEGFNNALLEAMAAGLPVVATDVGGNREALGNGRWGVLVPPHAPERIAEAVEGLLSDGQKSRAMGREASAWVREGFGVGKMVSRYVDLYEKLRTRHR
ncbi:MAG: glycosyltransferase [Proteobacteria bacterium]|nr:glycosyltransferase [Pseudomonadota bacterium]MBU1452090.1 glycosyltransferase [Pseudomonadota bacterium]MBU2467287.1 glycosyltransferase [Pseudomonadota bacterium]MBU2517372.1 glycosyltransferase [Pseudomonadota bacterium]